MIPYLLGLSNDVARPLSWAFMIALTFELTRSFLLPAFDLDNTSKAVQRFGKIVYSLALVLVVWDIIQGFT